MKTTRTRANYKTRRMLLAFSPLFLSALCLLTNVGQAQTETAEQEAPADAQTPAQRSIELSRGLGEWRELFQLDLGHELLKRAPKALESEEWKTDGEALALYARALREAGQTQAAAKLLEESSPTEITQIYVELERAKAALEQDQFDQVWQLLGGQKGPTSIRYQQAPEAFLIVARALVRSGQTQAAAPLLQHFTKTAPLHVDGPAAWHMLSQEALQRRDGQAAQEYREKAQAMGSWHAFYKARKIQVRENPTEPLPRMGIAQLLVQVNAFEAARFELTELLNHNAGYSDAWSMLAEVERKLGNRQSAILAYNRALELAPEKPIWRYNRALLLFQKRDYIAARNDLVQIVDGPESKTPQLLNSHLLLARTWLRLERKDQAQSRYEIYTQQGGQEPLNK